MKLHPRLERVQKAKLKLNEAVWNVIKDYDLTYMEIIGILSDETRTVIKYGIRHERHPRDPDKKGDEA